MDHYAAAEVVCTDSVEVTHGPSARRKPGKLMPSFEPSQ